LNIPEITVLIDSPTYIVLKSINDKVDGEFILSVESTPEGDMFRVILNLASLPVTNRLYMSQVESIDAVLRDTLRVAELKVQQKTLNYFLQKVSKDVLTESGFDDRSGYTIEQLDLLSEHGLTSTLIYKGVDNQKQDTNDSYWVRTMDLQMKGMSSIPKVGEEVIPKIKGSDKLNANGVIMKDYILTLQQKINMGLASDSEPVSLLEDTIRFDGSRDFFEGELERVKDELFELRMNLAIMKIGKILTGGWWEGLTPNGKDSYLYTKDGVTLVIKTDRKKVDY
jgi:hypothetical protein